MAKQSAVDTCKAHQRSVQTRNTGYSMYNHSRVDQDTLDIHTGPAQGQSKTQPKHSALSTGCETQTDRRRRLSTSGLSPPTIISQPSVQPSMASTFNIACPACRQLGALTAVTGPSSPNAHKRRRAISPHRAGVWGDGSIVHRASGNGAIEQDDVDRRRGAEASSRERPPFIQTAGAHDQ